MQSPLEWQLILRTERHGKVVDVTGDDLEAVVSATLREIDADRWPGIPAWILPHVIFQLGGLFGSLARSIGAEQ